MNKYVRCTKGKNRVKNLPHFFTHGWIELVELITNITFLTFFDQVLAEKISIYEKHQKKSIFDQCEENTSFLLFTLNSTLRNYFIRIRYQKVSISILVREYFTQHDSLSNIDYVRGNPYTPLALANQSTPLDQKLSSIFTRRSNRHLIANKVTDIFFPNFVFSLRKSIFSKSVVKCLKIGLIFRDFDYQNLIFMQNKYDIRNHHQKLHRITYILFKNIFRRNSTSGGPQGTTE